MTVSKGGKFTNIYIGNGMKRGDPAMNPTEPPEVMADPVDQVEQPEPTPLHEPVEKPKEEGEGGEEGGEEAE